MKVLALALCGVAAAAVGAAAAHVVTQRALLGHMSVAMDTDDDFQGSQFELYGMLQAQALGDDDAWCSANFIDFSPGRVEDSAPAQNMMCRANVQRIDSVGSLEFDETEDFNTDGSSPLGTYFCAVGTNMGGMVRAAENTVRDQLFDVDSKSYFRLRLRSPVTHFMVELVNAPQDTVFTLLLDGEVVATVHDRNLGFDGGFPADNTDDSQTTDDGAGSGRYILSAPLPGGSFDEIQVAPQTAGAACIKGFATPCNQVSSDDNDGCTDPPALTNETVAAGKRKRAVDDVESDGKPRDISVSSMVGARLTDKEFESHGECLTNFDLFDEGFVDRQLPARLPQPGHAVANILFEGQVALDGETEIDSDVSDGGINLPDDSHAFCPLADNIGGVVRNEREEDHFWAMVEGAKYVINLTTAVDRVYVQLASDPTDFVVDTWLNGKRGDSASFSVSTDDEAAGVFVIEAAHGKFDRIDLVQAAEVSVTWERKKKNWRNKVKLVQAVQDLQQRHGGGKGNWNWSRPDEVTQFCVVAVALQGC